MTAIDDELRKAFKKIKTDLEKDNKASSSDLKKAEVWASLLKEKTDIEKNNTRNKR